MAPHGDDDHYHPQDAISGGLHAALVTGGAGLFVAAAQNALQKQNVGAWSVFTRGGRLTATFGSSIPLFFGP